MVVGICAGMLGDRYGRKRLALAGLALMALGGALGAAVDAFVPLLVSRFVEGVGFILFAVPAPALMSAMSADARSRAKALGLWSAYMPTGGTVALLAAPVFIAVASWRALWLAIAAAAVLAAIAIARAVPATPTARVSSLRLLVESLAQAIIVRSAFERGTSTAAASAATALMVLVNAPGNLAGGWFLSRGVPRAALVITASVIAGLCEIGMLAPALPGAARYALVLVFSACTGVIPASVFAGLPVHARSPQHIATGNGMVLQLSNIGQFFGPLAIAWIVSHYGGWEATLWAMLAFAIAAAVCGVALGRIERRRR